MDEAREKDNGLFAYGEGTLMQLREQSWQLDDLGTCVVAPAPVAAPELLADATVAMPVAEAPAVAAPSSPDAVADDRLARIERKLDALQRRLDSIDLALARFMAR